MIVISSHPQQRFPSRFRRILGFISSYTQILQGYKTSYLHTGVSKTILLVTTTNAVNKLHVGGLCN